MKLYNGQVIDRYTVDALLGAGGTAMVYRVRHNHLGTLHALKVLTLSSAAIRERMLREGQVQASLRHLNVVAVSDVLDLDGAPGLLMEYIEGPSLERALGQFRLTMGDAEVLFQGIVAGVRQAHRFGLVHRDLKPANVLLARTQQGFVPKVTDFGLAKVLEHDPSVAHTRSGIAMGTPSYMAPEQIRDARTVDQRADVWSLGCVLYELVTRHRAFPGDEALPIYNAVTGGDYVPPRHHLPDLPDRLDQAIRGCMTVDRERRIPSCDALLDVLAGRRAWQVDDGGAEETAEISSVREAAAEILHARAVSKGSFADDPTRKGTRAPFPEPTRDDVFGYGGLRPPLDGGEATQPGPEPPLAALGSDVPEMPVAARTEGGGTPRPPPVRSDRVPLPSASHVDRSGGAGLGMVPLAAPGQRTQDPDTVVLRGSPMDGTLDASDSLLPVDADDEEHDRSWVGLVVIAGSAFVLGTGALLVALTLLGSLLFVDQLAPPRAPGTPAALHPPVAPDDGLDDAPDDERAWEEPVPAPAAPKVAPAAPKVAAPKVAPPRPDAAAAVKPAPPPKPAPSPEPAPPAKEVAPAPKEAPAGVSEAPGDVVAGAEVKVLSVPPTATLIIDGAPAGRTPAKVELAPGRHVVGVQSGDRFGEFAIEVRADADNKWCFAFGPTGPTGAGTVHEGGCP